MAEKLTLQQQMAVTDRGGKLLVSAAAGSGKTKVLVDRLLGYLTDPVQPANLDEFLIITYTKAAAAELRGKIAAKLTERIAAEPENRHLQRQMQRLYLAKISTVHGFCGDILREYAYKLDLPGDFRVADETECGQLQLQVLDKVLDSAYETAGEDPDFCAFVDSQGFGRNDRQVPDILLKVYHSSRCHLDPECWLDWCVSVCTVDGMTDAAQTLWGNYLLSDLQACLDMHMEALKKCAELAARSEGMEKPAALLRETLTQLATLRECTAWDEVVAHRQIDYGRLTFSKKCTDLELAERIKAVRSACKKALESRLRTFADGSAQVLADLTGCSAAARGLVKLTRQFAGAYDKVKQSRRILDFSDLEQKTLDLLLGKKRSGPTAAAAEIGQRFREIMVDEYQDSNGVQDAIFSALTQKRQNCFMVGDVKQSIYQFRLADPNIFIEKYNAFAPAGEAAAGQGRKVLLSSNFRSSGGVISAVNDVFTTCMSRSVGGLAYTDAEMLNEGIPHVALPEPEVELYAVPVVEDTYAEEAAFVAGRICQLLDGTHMIRQGDALRPITPGDIVILLRSPGSVGGEFRYALEERGLRCASGGDIDLLQTEEVGVLRSLLQIISNPLQDIPLIATLMSPAFGFTADDVAAFRSANRRDSVYQALFADASPKAQNFIGVLSELRRTARMCSLSELLECIFRHTRLDSIYAAMADGEARTANLHTFCQVVSDFENNGPRDLGQLLEHLDSMEEKGLLSSGEQTASDAITIMSIHKSKGLEFPVVFLCGLSRDFNRESAHAQVLCDRELGLGLACVDTRNRVRYASVAKRAIAAKTLSDGLSEELRVLYVAMTRARDRLIMTYAAKYLESDISDIALRMDLSSQSLMTGGVSCPGGWVLYTALGRAEAGELFSLGGKPVHTKVCEPAWAIRVAKTDSSADAPMGQTEDSQTLPPETVGRIGKFLEFSYPHAQATEAPSKLTATQLKGRYKDQEAAENAGEQKQIQRSFRAPSFASQVVQGKTYGNAVHAAMQYIRYDACGDAEGVDREIKRLVSEGFLSAEQGEMVDREKIVALFSTELGQNLRSADNVLREFKFSILDDACKYQPGVAGDQVLLQGVVDCALIEDDGITVIDYKTDHVTEETLPAVAERYRSQVKAYADALSRIYQLPIKSTQIYFFHISRFAPVE